jgi:hypothetical protein
MLMVSILLPELMVMERESSAVNALYQSAEGHSATSNQMHMPLNGENNG